MYFGRVGLASAGRSCLTSCLEALERVS